MSGEFNYHQSELNFYGSNRHQIPLEENFEETKELPQRHREILEENFEEFIGKDRETVQITNLAINHYEGEVKEVSEQSGIFTKGVDMSLCDVGGRIILIATSGDVHLIATTKSSVVPGPVVIKYKIGDDREDCPLSILHFPDKQEVGLEKPLRNWACFMPKFWKSQAGYKSILSFKMNGERTPTKWFEEKKLASPLVFVTYNIMLHYYDKHKESQQGEIMNWFENNLELDSL